MISPILNNGIVAQTQNVSAINNGDETRAQINYHNTNTIVETQREIAHNRVVASQDSNKSDTHHDAKEEGRNKYFNNRNGNSSKKHQSDDSAVVKKSPGGFDMSI